MKTKTFTVSRPALRHVTGYTLIAAAVCSLAAQTSFAQEGPPPDDAPSATQSAGNVDPPGRVARLNYTSGAVTTEPAGATDWSYAQINRPLTTGDQLWDDQNARAELHIGSTAVRLGDSTSLDILNLDDSNAQLKIAQGTLSTRVRELAPGSTYEIDTPNLALGVTGPGDYRVDVAPDGSSTTVTVRSGSATVYGDNGQVPVAAGQQIRFAGTALQQVADNGAPGLDGFDQWAAGRDAAEDRSVSARYVSRDVPGYEDLDANGTWRSNPQYGEVWVPSAVPAGWAPYHDGHWVWQAPWGWTWVDDAPWGFAPYHYGRWAYVDDSWAWVPGPVVVSEQPVYAPALVAFVGDGGGSFDWGVSLAVGGVAAAGLAWFPLGPGEPWHPRGGGWSPGYYNRVNNYDHRVNVTNITNIHNTYINYRAPGGVTAVPATAFVHGQPVGRFAQKVDPRQWRNAQFNPGGPGIAPVRQSFDSGMRNANYRPPAAATARSVVATRSPSVPAAYHDTLAQRFAQGGGRVPGAGEPIVRTSVPAHFAGAGTRGGLAAATAQNVRVVQANSPRMATGAVGAEPHVAQNAAQGAARPGEPALNGAPRPSGFGGTGPNGAQAPRGVAEQGRPGTPGAPVAPAQLANERPQPNNGVPRPPQAATAGANPNSFAQRNGVAPATGQQAAAEARHEPAWTQPHTPMAIQAQQHGSAPQQGGAAREPFAQQAGGPQNRQPQAGFAAQQQAQERGAPHPAENPAAAARAPQEAQREPNPAQQQQQQQARATEYRQQAAPPAQQAQREEARPQAQTQAQPRPEYRPQQVQQAPRPEYHPQPQAQAQPRPEYHPQQVQQAPRPEYHPQQVQQPRPEARPPQQAQQPHAQPRQEQHSNNGGHEEHRRG
ncbi:DUF6600 domain-containing protein [Paraburkholderia sp. BCC1885]|uniref:DUF6600 domain-containing protein n=1 Tax=Paraburkholderia sp. BCC1885 TaxID=2562669 RepID=UPI001183BBCA|nr:DUF6600 domain-containing protein [Paraburkholderia sp. BCC1885]